MSQHRENFVEPFEAPAASHLMNIRAFSWLAAAALALPGCYASSAVLTGPDASTSVSDAGIDAPGDDLDAAMGDASGAVDAAEPPDTGALAVPDGSAPPDAFVPPDASPTDAALLRAVGEPCASPRECRSGACGGGVCLSRCGTDCECAPYQQCDWETGNCAGCIPADNPDHCETLGRLLFNRCATCVPDCRLATCGQGGCTVAPVTACGGCPGSAYCNSTPDRSCAANECRDDCGSSACACYPGTSAP